MGAVDIGILSYNIAISIRKDPQEQFRFGFYGVLFFPGSGTCLRWVVE